MAKILLRSSWQVVNIGDIAHTPGVLALIEKNIPEAEVTLWASEDFSDEVAAMEHKRFPKLKIVKGTIDSNGNASNEALSEAIHSCDFLLHGSGPLLVGYEDIKAFVKCTGKPFGVFGITYGGFPGDDNHKELLNQAKFIYFRDTVSLAKAKELSITCPIMEFGPDAAFTVDLRDDASAIKFLKKSGLEEGKFLCCIPRLRYTPFWKVKNVPVNLERMNYNYEMKEHDHKPLRDAIIAVVRETGLKVLICPEDMTQIELGKELLLDKLPEDVLKNVVWKEDFWLTDEAISVYIRSAGLFGNEMHSPIMCIANGIPAIVCRWKEQTSKGFMWRDIGLGEWLFNLDFENEISNLVPTVLEIVNSPLEAKAKAMAAKELVNTLQLSMVNTLRTFLQIKDR
jgi:polysaccharide pyruvyl transferase WcaK-like protein